MVWKNIQAVKSINLKCWNESKWQQQKQLRTFAGLIVPQKPHYRCDIWIPWETYWLLGPPEMV